MSMTAPVPENCGLHTAKVAELIGDAVFEVLIMIRSRVFCFLAPFTFSRYISSMSVLASFLDVHKLHAVS
jgi:hypothetical protein